MKHSFRQKIHILRTILKEYALYLNKFNNSNCYARGKYIVITFFREGQGFYDLKRRIPKRDIDTLIARYRAKLYNEKKKEQKRQEQNKIILFDFMYKLKMIG